MAQRKEIQLGYWSIRGMAQPIRLLLEYLELPYTERRYEVKEMPNGEGWDRSDWLNEKFNLKLDFPNNPWIIDGDTRLTQSATIIRYLCRKYNSKLLGQTVEDMTTVDLLTDVIADYRASLSRVCYSDPSMFPKLKDEWKTTTMPTFLNSTAEFMKREGDYVLPYVTFADFILYEYLDYTRLFVPEALDDPKYSKLRTFLDKMEHIPQLKRYMASDKYIKRPINNKMACFK